MSGYSTLLRFWLSIIGGPYDGVDGLPFVTPNAELPPVIVLDRCPGDERCGMRGHCRPGHVAYWIPELEDAPPAAIAYVLEEDSVEVNGWDGSARYVMGGLPGWGRGETVELAGVGASEGVVAEVNRDGRTVRVRLWEVS